MENTIGGVLGLSLSLGEVLVPLLFLTAIFVIFTFIGVAVWSENRRREREAYYRSETLRKAIEKGGEACASVIEMMREEELRQARRRIDGLRLGGLVTIAAGAGFMVFLYFLGLGEFIWLAGLVALLIGLVLAIYGYTQSPPPPGAGPERKQDPRVGLASVGTSLPRPAVAPGTSSATMTRSITIPKAIRDARPASHFGIKTDRSDPLSTLPLRFPRPMIPMEIVGIVGLLDAFHTMSPNPRKAQRSSSQ